MSLASKKVPVAVVTGIICLGLGAAGGLLLAGFVQEPKKDVADETAKAGEGDDTGKQGVGPVALAKGGKGGPSGAKGAKGGKGGPGGGGPGGGAARSRQQLAQLVGRLDALTARPLSITFTPEEKQEVKKILDGLDAKDELTEEEARGKLDALLKVVEKHKDTLEAAGFRPGGGGPGGAGGGGPPIPPNVNPFKGGGTAVQLKALRATLEK